MKLDFQNLFGRPAWPACEENSRLDSDLADLRDVAARGKLEGRNLLPRKCRAAQSVYRLLRRYLCAMVTNASEATEYTRVDQAGPAASRGK